MIATNSRWLIGWVLAGGTTLASAAFSEAPTLHELVATGKLPPLEQRLPAIPLIVTPVEKPGHYGGAWHLLLNGYDHGSLLSRSIGYEQLVRWDPNWSRVLPNLAISWTVNTNATIYRFRLRPGVHWSDGHHFTAHDLVAWMDDVARDPELNPDPPAWLVVEKRLPDCVAVDDYTLEFKFHAPNALFLEQLAGMRANELTRYPAHYFRKFHYHHSPEGAEKLVRDTGLRWAQAFRTRYTPWTWRNADTPSLDPWVLATPYEPGVTNVLALRNPYYWKIDTLGRQLPYLDRVEMAVTLTAGELSGRAIAGQTDYQREGLDLKNLSDELSAADAGGKARPVRIIPSIPNSTAICLNLVHRDPHLRAALANREVRIALSEAIDRPQIIAEVYEGRGIPWQLAPRPESPFHNATLGKQHTEYAPDRSRQRLEQAGLPLDASTGLRRLADGRPFRIKLLVPAVGNDDWPSLLNRVGQSWRAIGVDLSWEVLPREAFYKQVSDNQHDGAVWWGGGGHAATLEPEYYVPVTFERLGPLRVFHAVPWVRWFLDPTALDAEEPPATVRRQMDLFRQVMAEPNQNARAALMSQVIALAADEFYVMGICLASSSLAIRTPSFHNVPGSHFDSWLYPDPGPLNPCQFYQELPPASAP